MLAALVPAVLLFQTPEPHAEPSVIRFGTEAARPPFHFLDSAGEPQGFEIDLVRAMCQRMKRQCQFVVIEWDNLWGSLLEKRIDAVVGSLEITEERKTRYLFTQRLYKIPDCYVVRKDDEEIKDIKPETLKGKTIGTLEETFAAQYLEKRIPDVTVRSYATRDDVMLDLVNDRIDLVLVPKPIALEWFETQKEASCCRILADAPNDDPLLGEGVGIGLRKRDKELKTQLDKALAEIKADGTYETIRKKYLPYKVE